MNPTSLLLHLIGDAPVVPVYVRAEDTANGRKAAYPTRVSGRDDRDSLVSAHLAGTGIPTRTCTRSDGTAWTESRAFAIGSYAFQHGPDGALCRWAAMDIDGGNHANGDDYAALSAFHEAVRLIRTEGWVPLVVRSHSGRGFHVWIIFLDPQPAAFAHWLASLIADLVLKLVPCALVEAFPKQAHAELGNPLAAPFAGAVAAHSGGTLVYPDSLDQFAFTRSEALEPFKRNWKRWAIERERAEQRRQARDRRRASKMAKGGDAIERCRKYLLEVPPAVAGAHGDAATFKAAMVGGDFGLSDQDFLPLLREWNSRCSPPWSDSDLEKKLNSAHKFRKSPGSKSKPFGWKVVSGG